MTFHKEGYPTLLLSIILVAILGWLAYSYAPQWLQWLTAGLCLFLLVVVLQFFRSPDRQLPEPGKHLFYTPADGEIVVIEKTTEKEYLNEECWQVSVFMSPLNVHINRNPIDARVDYLKYHPGKYLVAWHPKSSELNERFTTVYDTGKQKILIRQIAGALARRIVNYLEVDQEVKQGDEMGFIKFGSRVDIFLPLDAEIKVRPGQKVKSPLDVIAVLK